MTVIYGVLVLGWVVPLVLVVWERWGRGAAAPDVRGEDA